MFLFILRRFSSERGSAPGGRRVARLLSGPGLRHRMSAVAASALGGDPAVCVGAARGGGLAGSRRRLRRPAQPAWQPVVAKRQLVLQGGLAKKPVPVLVRDVVCEGVARTFVPLSSTCGWVCFLVAGVSAGIRPLSRSRVLKKLQQLVSSICALESMDAEVATRSSAAVAAHSSAAVAAGTSFAALCGDRMAELAPSDDEEVVTPPKKARRLRERRRQTQANLAPFLTVHLPASWADFNKEGGALRPLSVLNDARALWVALDDVPWLLSMLYEERAHGFQAPPPPPEPADVPGICWIFRDSCWQGKKRLSDGSFATKRVHVTRRAKRGNYEEAKAAAWAEIEEWARMPE